MPLADIPFPAWLAESGPDGDVAVSTRCRLARNLADEPFPWRAADPSRRRAADTVLDACRRAGGRLGDAPAFRGEDLDPETASRLVEWRYASPDWARGGPHRWLLVAPDAATSVLVNEEDHLRLQAILPGLQVESGLERVEEVMEALAARLPLARDDRFGWLTASPVNAGTGLRVSVMLHLAGLAASDSREAVLEAAAGVGCAVRGLYGEGTSGTGELFQVSNTWAHGLKPGPIVERVAAAASYLVEVERRARRQRFGNAEGRADLAAAARRAWRQLFAEESAPRRLLPLVSVLRLAVAEGVLPGDLARTSEWIALAGVDAASGIPADPPVERYEAVRRSAELRRRLRAFMRAEGTSSGGFAD